MGTLSHLIAERERTTMAARIVYLTLVAAIIAFGSAQEWDDVESSAAEFEFLQAPTTPPATVEEYKRDQDTLSHEMHGSVVAPAGEAVAYSEPSDNHEAYTCAAGEVACEDGSCVADTASCPEAGLAGTAEHQFEEHPDATY